MIYVDPWEQLPATLREIYVAGAINQLSTVGVPAGLSSAKHYNECIVKSGVRLGEIAEGTKKFMEMHSDSVAVEQCANATSFPTAKMSGGAGVTVVSAPTGSSPQQAFGIWLQYVA
jgi:hypothetical protein